MRDLFVGQLERLTYEIVEMGGICEEAIQKGSEALLSGDADLAKSTRRMLRDVLNAYETKDVGLARDVMAYDDTVDEFFHKTKNNLAELLKNAGDDSAATDYVLDLLMVDKYYERIGDHIVKIAEAVEYYVTNQVVK